MTLWAGRFDAAPDAAAFEFGRSFPFDRRLFEDDVAGSIAWAEALTAAGALTRDEGATIVSALGDILAEGTSDPRLVDGPDEDVHTFVERQLVSRIGEVGRKLHTGRSRNEQVSLDLRLYLRRRIPDIQQAIAALIRALADQADEAGSALMPAYTHLRRAQPILVAHFLLAHAAALRRDHERLEGARKEADALPLGSGAVAGTNYAVDVSALAARLGFSDVVRNSIDASADRDFVAAFLNACALLMVHLSRAAEDLIVLTTEEFGLFDIADTVATGSSLMPQKKNPDPLELVRGKTGRVIGRLTGWLTTMKGLPSGYNKDLQEDKEAVFDAESAVAGALAAMAAVVRGLSLNREAAARAAGGLLLATDVADYLVARGVAFRRAHELVGGMVRQLLVEHRDFAALSLAEWRRFSDLFDEDVLAVVTPERSVAARRTPQSTSPVAVSRALGETRAWLESAGAASPSGAGR
jgi:argininosuccinate lyase